MKLRNITLGMMTAGAMLMAGGSLAQPQPTTPAPATQDAPATQSAPASPGAPATQTAPATPGAAAPDAGKSTLDGDDKDFLENAAQAGHAEIEGSKMAQEKAKDPDVKAFADKMIQDHTKVGEELAALASKKGYTPPEGPSLLQKAKIKTLSLTDDGFDGMYIDQIGVSAHEDAVKLFQDASANAKDPDIKAFAAEHLPALQEHLSMAQQLQEKQKARK